jgi:hypothetical protein
VHSDAWLMAVAFYYGAKFDAKKRCGARVRRRRRKRTTTTHDDDA